MASKIFSLGGKPSGRDLVVLIGLFFACRKNDAPLAPYAGRPELSGFQIEAGSFAPKMTWIGGYVSALGVNRGSRAALDSTLIWLIHAQGDGVRFPVQFGTLPAGVEDLTLSSGGIPEDSLTEDNPYTFWLLKETAWEAVLQNPGKDWLADPQLPEGTAVLRDDTLHMDPYQCLMQNRMLDVYVNIRDFKTFGRLAILQLGEPKTSNHPVFSWTIQQAGVTDTLVAALGLVKADSYKPDKLVWEVWSEEQTGAAPVYGKKNVISAPVRFGQTFPETRAFTEYPEQGLERNKTYYLWIASSGWDGLKHSRAANFYAYASFNTW
ncbi:hypothetical protein JW906_10635 [bacterium]|nr:hypothetical protein [bacterium]